MPSIASLETRLRGLIAHRQAQTRPEILLCWTDDELAEAVLGPGHTAAELTDDDLKDVIRLQWDESEMDAQDSGLD